MPVPVQSGLTDDNDFVELVRTIIGGILLGLNPEQLWIIQVNNWFDHKWLRYSGNGIIANWRYAGVPSSDFMSNRFDTVKTDFFRDKTTFPPFSPDRVLGQWSYVRSGDGYSEVPLPDLPHGTERAPSSSNLNRRIEASNGKSCFVWYSGNSLKNGRGSLMVYTVQDVHVDCWFAAFERSQGWTLAQTKGISRGEVLLMMTGTGAATDRD
jgi:hypothetical protein